MEWILPARIMSLMLMRPNSFAAVLLIFASVYLGASSPVEAEDGNSAPKVLAQINGRAITTQEFSSRIESVANPL
jgi:hypothetical protein